MQDFSIEEGGMYVNERKELLRLAQRIDESGVYWRDFGLTDGMPIGHGVCQEPTFRNWADRPATDAERGRLRWELALAKNAEFIEEFLKRISDVVLDDEHDKRGLFDRRLEGMLASGYFAPTILHKISDEQILEEFQRRGLERLSQNSADADGGGTRGVDLVGLPSSASRNRRTKKH